jgi:hypothetical protein
MGEFVKSIFILIGLLIMPHISQAAQDGGTLCGRIERSQYCRSGQCSPVQYELVMLGQRAQPRFNLQDYSNFISQIDPFANTGSPVCLNGYAFSLATFSPGDFHVKGVLSPGEAVPNEQTQVTGILRRWKSFYFLNLVTDSPLCRTIKQIKDNPAICDTSSSLTIKVDASQFMYNNGATTVDPVRSEAINNLVQLTGKQEKAGGLLEVYAIHVINN